MCYVLLKVLGIPLPSLQSSKECFPAPKMVAFVPALHQSSVCTLSGREEECENMSLTVFVSCLMLPCGLWINLDSDSLTGEDSLLDCSLLSNPAADLLDEFAPVAFAAQPHKGKLTLCL